MIIVKQGYSKVNIKREKREINPRKKNNEKK